MQELETKIAVWRAQVSAAMPGQEETVRELEAHLRDDIEVQLRRGLELNQAFEHAVRWMGEPRAVAREFKRVPQLSGLPRPMVAIYGLVGAAFVAILAEFVEVCYRYWPKISFLEVAYAMMLWAGYLALIAAGLVGAWAIATGWRRSPTEREVHTQRRELFRLAAWGSGLTPVGLAMLMIWIHGDFPYYFGVPYRVVSWVSLQVGAAAVIGSTWLLLLVQLRAITTGRVRTVISLLGASIVGLAQLCGYKTALPIGWLSLAAILSHGGMAFLNARSKRAAADDEREIARA